MSGTTSTTTTTNHLMKLPPSKEESNEADSQMIFDMMVPALFESIQESLHKIISSKLNTLPLFDKKDHKLVDDISKRYSQDMDAVELYSKRYLFGIRKKLFTTKQRETILAEYIRRKHGPSSSANTCSNTNTRVSTNTSVSTQMETPILPNITDPTFQPERKDQHLNLPDTFHVPSLQKDIPTEENIKNLDEEISSLRQELRKAKAKSSFYTSQLQSIQNVRNHTQHATNIITQPQQQSHEHKDVNHYADKMIDSVTAAMIGKEGLSDMTTKGKHLLTEMTFITKVRTISIRKNYIHKKRRRDLKIVCTRNYTVY
jgi:hypothetical protein